LPPAKFDRAFYDKIARGAKKPFRDFSAEFLFLFLSFASGHFSGRSRQMQIFSPPLSTTASRKTDKIKNSRKTLFRIFCSYTFALSFVRNSDKTRNLFPLSFRKNYKNLANAKSGRKFFHSKSPRVAAKDKLLIRKLVTKPSKSRKKFVKVNCASGTKRRAQPKSQLKNGTQTKTKKRISPRWQKAAKLKTQPNFQRRFPFSKFKLSNFLCV